MNFMSLKKKIAGTLAFLTVSTFGLGIVNIQSVEAFQSQVPTPVIQTILNNYIASENSSLSAEERQYMTDNIIYYSYQYGVDPLVMASLFSTESNFHQSSRSSVGAIGLGQIMPSTAVALGVNPYDLKENIEGACSYLSTQIKNFSNEQYPVEMALASYNAGPNAVRKYGGIPPYSETQNYVNKIRNKYFSLYSQMVGALNTNNAYSPISTTSSYQQYPSNTNTGYTVEQVNAPSYNVSYVSYIDPATSHANSVIDIFDAEDDYGY